MIFSTVYLCITVYLCLGDPSSEVSFLFSDYMSYMVSLVALHGYGFKLGTPKNGWLLQQID